VDPRRVKAVILGKAFLQDRDEEEVRGYRSERSFGKCNGKTLWIALVEDRAPCGRKRVLPLKEGKNKGIIAGLIFRGLIMARKKAPELTFQEHIAAYLVREHGYPGRFIAWSYPAGLPVPFFCARFPPPGPR
jgi:hypothetical protein